MFIIQIIEWLTEFFSGTNLNFEYSNAWIEAIMDIVSFVSWCIPLDAIIVCFLVSVAAIIIRLAIAVYRLIPFNG